MLVFVKASSANESSASRAMPSATALTLKPQTLVIIVLYSGPGSYEGAATDVNRSPSGTNASVTSKSCDPVPRSPAVYQVSRMRQSPIGSTKALVSGCPSGPRRGSPPSVITPDATM